MRGPVWGTVLVVLALAVFGVLASQGFLSPAAVSTVPTPVPSPTAIPNVPVTVISNGSTCAFLKNPKLQAIVGDPTQMETVVNRKESLRISAICQGTIEMVDASKGDEQTEMWLAQDLGLTRYRFSYDEATHDYTKDSGRRFISYDYDLFSTQLVLVAQKPVAQAMVAKGLATREGDITIINTAKFIEALRTKQTWSSIGVNKDGPITVNVAHPAQDESGMIWSGLVARHLLGDSAYDEANINRIWPDMTTVIDSRRDMASSSKSLMDKFLGEDASAAIVFENQYAEFYLKSPPAVQAKMKEKFEVVQMRPTGTASFPFLARTPGGVDLVTALLTHPAIRELAFKEHLLRDPTNVLSDDKIFLAVGLPSAIQDRADLPNKQTMNLIVDKWKKGR